MPKFKLEATWTVRGTIEVEAENLTQAFVKDKDLFISHYQQQFDGDFKYDLRRFEEITEQGSKRIPESVAKKAQKEVSSLLNEDEEENDY